jgi:YesN/AraC family two-component response regulator
MNIFVVEDEHWALTELIELFKIYEPAHRVYAFSNGEDALAAAARSAPMLVVTDINMPGMDGLELIRALNRVDQAVKGIILSVHDQFAYAQQGMKIGALDYLLKPVKKDVLYKTVDKAIVQIENETKQSDERKRLSVAQLLFASAAADNEVSLTVNRRKYGIALLMMENRATAQSGSEVLFSDVDLKRNLLYGDIREQDIYCVDLDRQRKAILIPVDDGSGCFSIRAGLMDLYRKLNDSGIHIHLCYMFKQANEEINKCFSLLNKQLEGHRRFGGSTFVSPEIKAEDADLSGMWDKVRALQAFIKRGDMPKAKEMIRKLSEELQTKEMTVRQLTQFVSDLLYSLKYNLLSSSAADIRINTWQEDSRALQEMSGYEELTEWLADKAFSLFSNSMPKDSKPKNLVPILLNWIHGHYQHELSLQQFAADNHVSLGYLSRLFKAQTGSTFSDYVIRYRIGKAKQLMAEGVDRLADISSLVGYEDAKHFSLLFKKIAGEPPHAFLKRIRANNANNN